MRKRSELPVNIQGERESFGGPKVFEVLPELTAQLPDNLTVPSVGAMNVWTAPWSTVMLETKYLRLATAVTLGSRFGDWCVCWRGGWSRHRIFYLVMLVRVEPSAQASPTRAPSKRESHDG